MSRSDSCEKVIVKEKGKENRKMIRNVTAQKTQSHARNHKQQNNGRQLGKARGPTTPMPWTPHQGELEPEKLMQTKEQNS